MPSPTGDPAVDKVGDNIADAFNAANEMEHCEEVAVIQALLGNAARKLNAYTKGARTATPHHVEVLVNGERIL